MVSVPAKARSLFRAHFEIFAFCVVVLLVLIYRNQYYPEIFWADDVYHLQHSSLLSKGDLRYAVDKWTRPLHAIPCAAAINILGYSMFSCRLVNMLMLSMTCMLLYFIVYHYTQSKAVSMFSAVAFIISPLAVNLAYSILSEIEFCFVLSIAYYAMVKKHPYLSSFAASLLPLIRSEGMIMIGMWGLYYSFTNMMLKDKLSIGFILSIPTVIWSIASYSLVGLLFPFFGYPIFSQYESPSFAIYILNFLIGVGLMLSLPMVFGILNLLKLGFDNKPEFKFLTFIILTLLFFHAIISHFGLMGTIGSTVYMFSIFSLVYVPGAIFLNESFNKKSDEGKISNFKICAILTSLLILQFFHFYLIHTIGYFERPYSQDTLQFFELSQFFYDEIFMTNDSVQFCGAQVIYNVGDSDLKLPIQIRFQHNPFNEMPEICPKCSYYGHSSGAKWVIWNEGWCSGWTNDGRWIHISPDWMMNSSYELVKVIGNNWIYRINSTLV